MKKLNLLFSIGALLAAQSVGARAADSIAFDSLTTTPATLDLNNFPAFAFYADDSASLYSQAIGGTLTTDAHNVGGFTGVFKSAGASGAGYIASSSPSDTAVSYTGATSNVGQTSEAGDLKFAFADAVNAGDGIQITSTLFAPTETFQFYLVDYDSKSSLYASLNTGATSDATYQSLGNVLPNGFGATADGTGTSNTAGLLTLTVTGAVGDVLTFSNRTDITGVSNSSYYNTGIIAADVESVPEPAACAMLLVGLGALVWVARRQALRLAV
jgi:hypothetical protein